VFKALIAVTPGEMRVRRTECDRGRQDDTLSSGCTHGDHRGDHGGDI